MRNRQKDYTTRREKVVDFIIGFVGWFILNGLMGLASAFAPGLPILLGEWIQDPTLGGGADTMNSILGLVLLCLPLLINLGLLLYFAFTRYWIAIGGSSAFGATLVLTICAGIVFTVACFTILSTSNP
jgi:hypothetical protein